MTQEDRRRVRLALDVVTAARPDDELAAALGGHEEASAGFAVLAGFVLGLLAERRRETVAETVRFVGEALDRR